HEGWVYIDVEFNLDSVQGLLFSNGDNQQTRDLTLDGGVYLTYFGSFETQDEAEDAYNEFVNETTFYIYNLLDNTPILYIHYWYLKIDGNGQESTWPGVEATAVEGHDGWFEVVIPVHIMYTR